MRRRRATVLTCYWFQHQPLTISLSARACPPAPPAPSPKKGRRVVRGHAAIGRQPPRQRGSVSGAAARQPTHLSLFSTRRSVVRLLPHVSQRTHRGLHAAVAGAAAEEGGQQAGRELINKNVEGGFEDFRPKAGRRVRRRVLSSRGAATRSKRRSTEGRERGRRRALGLGLGPGSGSGRLELGCP